MSFEFKLAWRYFRSRRKNLVRFTAIIAFLGIALGVASLIIAQALARGFSEEMKDKVLSNTSHITIFDEGKTVASDWQIIKQQVEPIENVANFQPTTYESVVISSDTNSSYGVLRVGAASSINERESGKAKGNSLDKKQTSEATADKQNVPIIAVSIGRELAQKLKLKIGDEANLITLENEDTPKNSKVKIKDIFQTGLYEYDLTWIFVDKANYLKVKEIDKFTPKVFSVSVKDIYKADKTAEKIRQKIGGAGFKVLDWQEANRPLFAALSLERKVALAIILLIILLAVLNITTTLSLLVNERKLDIAILRTCGAKTKSIVAVFLFEGMILSFGGILFGIIIGLSVCFAGNYFKIISLSKEVYSLNHIPFQTDLQSVLAIVGLTFLLSLAAIFYPALKASKIKPLENLERR